MACGIKTGLLKQIKGDSDERLVEENWNNPVVTSSCMFIDQNRIPVRCIIPIGYWGKAWLIFRLCIQWPILSPFCVYVLQYNPPPHMRPYKSNDNKSNKGYKKLNISHF